MVLHRLRLKCNCSCVLSGLRNTFSKVYKISPLLNKIMLKFYGFLWTQCSLFNCFSGTITTVVNYSKLCT